MIISLHFTRLKISGKKNSRVSVDRQKGQYRVVAILEGILSAQNKRAAGIFTRAECEMWPRY